MRGQVVDNIQPAPFLKKTHVAYPLNIFRLIGLFGGLKDEVSNLKRDKNVLMLELVRLRQQQQYAEKEIRRLHKRLEKGEARQAELLHVFTQYLQSPEVLAQLLNQAKLRSIETRERPGHHNHTSHDDLKLIPYHRDRSSSPSDVAARIDHLLGTSPLEDPDHDLHSTPLRTIAHSTPSGHTVMGTPIIPDSMPASEFLARTSSTLYHPSSPQTPMTDFYKESLDFASRDKNEDTMMEEVMGQGTEGSTPFATEDVQSDAFVSNFPMEDVDMQLMDRYESDDYWKRFIAPTSTGV